jgi:hypothetical protein
MTRGSLPRIGKIRVAFQSFAGILLYIMMLIIICDSSVWYLLVPVAWKIMVLIIIFICPLFWWTAHFV